MTIIKKLNKKIIAAVLSFAMVLTGVFSFGAIKKETASAAMVTPAREFTPENVMNFGYTLVPELNLPSTPINSCLLVDSELFMTTEWSISDLENSPFFVGFSNRLIQYYNINVEAGNSSELTVAQIFTICSMEIVVNIYGTNNYINLMTGEEVDNVRTVTAFGELVNLDDPNYKIYAAGVWNLSSQYSTFLSRCQNHTSQYATPVFVFPREAVYDGGTLQIAIDTGNGYLTNL